MSDARLKAYIERVLRCREAEDVAKDDTKEVYKELAADGYEKAIVGQVVQHLRKREKDSDKVAEQSAKFDLYLAAYDRASHVHTRVSNAYAAAKGAATTFAAGEDHDPDSGKHVGRSDDEQRDAARVSSADGRREGADEGDQGQGAGASGIDRHGGPVEGTLARQDEDGRSGHVGREARHEITETDSDAFAAVKGKARLANVDDVEPSLSTFLPAPSSPQADRALEACPSPHASGAAISPAARIPTGAGGHLSEPSPDAGAGQQAADADHRNAKSGQAANSISDADVPAFLLKKAMAENEAA